MYSRCGFKGTILAAKYWRPSQIIAIYLVISLVYFAISTTARRLQVKLSVGRGSIGD